MKPRIGIRMSTGMAVVFKQPHEWLLSGTKATLMIAARHAIIPAMAFLLSGQTLQAQRTDEDKKADLQVIALAERNDAEAQFLLRNALEDGSAGAPQTLDEKIKWLRRAAEHKHSIAYFYLAYYYRSDGSKKTAATDAEAKMWASKAFDECFHKATQQNDPCAQYYLAQCAMMEIGTNHVGNAGGFWMGKAADGGDRLAQFYIGNHDIGCYKPVDREEGIKCLMLAAGQKVPKAENALGDCFYQNENFVTNYASAAAWYRKASDHRMPEAMYNLGICYLLGRGVPQNLVEAAKLIHRAADYGITEAKFNLGICFYYGFGVVRDRVEAMKWFVRAEHFSEVADWRDPEPIGRWRFNYEELIAANLPGAKSGDPFIQQMVGSLYTRTPDWDKAVKYYKLAAEQGLVSAQACLGLFDPNAYDLTRQEAAMWLHKAAEQNYAIAQNALGEGKGGPLSRDEAIYWFRKAAEQGLGVAQVHLASYYWWVFEPDFFIVNLGTNKEEASKWYGKAADLGMKDALFQLWAINSGKFNFERNAGLAEEYARRLGKPESVLYPERVKGLRQDSPQRPRNVPDYYEREIQHQIDYGSGRYPW